MRDGKPSATTEQSGWRRRSSPQWWKIQIQAGGATPAPPVGTALGPHGINIHGLLQGVQRGDREQRGQIIPVDISI
jgi:ribosomal protein L11